MSMNVIKAVFFVVNSVITQLDHMCVSATMDTFWGPMDIPAVVSKHTLRKMEI